MELAFATGRGPELLADIDGRAPLVRDDDVVVVGRRDAAEAAEADAHGSRRIEETPINSIDLAAVRAAQGRPRSAPSRGSLRPISRASGSIWMRTWSMTP
ncbi:MAG TPA: hypothetical protein VEB22_04370 [Phycisphaerales bacterium]|nr:hypothetical protein [Phycisphaerales bacterium]